MTAGSQQPVARPYLYDRERFIYNDLARRTGAVVFASSQGAEMSYELAGNGAFTAALKQVLTAEGTPITVDALRAAVVPIVAELTEQRQHPTIDRDNPSLAITLPRVRGLVFPVPSAAPSPSPPPPHVVPLTNAKSPRGCGCGAADVGVTPAIVAFTLALACRRRRRGNRAPRRETITAVTESSRDRPRVSREVVLLGWVSFFNDVSSEMIYPLLPMFLVVVLDASATSLGWVEGIAQALVALLAAWTGWHSDRIRRRVPYVQLGYALPVAGKLTLVAATVWPVVLVGRTIDRIGKGIRSSPRDALIADTTTPETRGAAFGLHRAMDSAGAVVGVVLAAVLVAALGSSDAAAFRIVFAVAAGLGLVAVGFTFVLREPVVAPRAGEAASAPASDTKLARRYWVVLAILLLFSLANSSDTFLLLRAQQVGLAPWAVVAAYAVFSVVYMAASYPAGVLSDRVGRWPLILVGWVLYAGVYAAIGYTGVVGIWPLLALYGVYIALTDGVAKALLADCAPRDRRGLALGIYYMASAGTTLVSSVVAGMLWDRVGSSATFVAGAIAAAAALLVALIARPWRTS